MWTDAVMHVPADRSSPDQKVISRLWLFRSPKISHGFQHSVSFVLINQSRYGNTVEEFVVRLVSHSFIRGGDKSLGLTETYFY